MVFLGGAAQFRTAISRFTDPLRLLFEAIPAAFDGSLQKRTVLLNRVGKCMQELAGVAGLYAEQAADAVRRAVALGRQAEEASVRDVAHRWSLCFSDGFIEGLRDGVAKGLLSRMRIPYDSDHLLLESLASLLVGQSLSRWDDNTLAIFEPAPVGP